MELHIKRPLAIIFLSVFYHNNRLHVKFGCSRAVLKFGSWQLKNGKITGIKYKIGQGVVKRWSNGHVIEASIHVINMSIIKAGQKSVKEWSNGHDLTLHGSSLLLKDSQKKF